MKFPVRKSAIICLILIFAGFNRLQGQDTISNGKAINVPLRKYGISIGNSLEFTGIRINYSDRNVLKSNGINLTIWSRFRPDYNKNQVVNGISLGGLATAKTMQPVNLFVVGGMAFEHLNGLSFGGIGIGSGNISGLCGSGIFLEGGTANGIVFSGLFTYGEEALNGISAGGLAVMTKGTINGAAISIAGIYSEKSINGIALTAGYLKANVTRGLTLGGYSNIRQVNGISIALLNRAEELRGMQIGVINIAKNNRKGLKCLPLINLHF